MQVLPGNALAFLDQELARPGAYDDLPELFRKRRYFDALSRLTSRILDALLKRTEAAGRDLQPTAPTQLVSSRGL